MERPNANAIKNLKSRIQELTSAKWCLREKLRTLKAQGPETGDERHQLRQDYNWDTRPVARATYLAYGLLRGRQYTQIEAKCNEPPLPNLVMQAIHEADEKLKEAYPLERILEWLDGKEVEKAA